MRLTVHLVAWNGSKYMPYLFASLRKQTFRDWRLYVLDNNSEDGTVEVIKKELNNFSVQYELIEKKENLGFAGGHNFLFGRADLEYFLLLNQDMYLQPDCLEKMADFLDAHPETAAVSPHLLKWDFSKIQNEGLEASLSNQVDALGLKIFRSRRVIEQYPRQDWDVLKSIFKTSILEVFGVSGALPMLRRAAMQNIAFDGGQFLDESYFAYKEDVDLAYRLLSAGYKSYVLLDAVAYHDRTGAGPKEMNDTSAAANKRKQPSRVRYHSYKNHLCTLYKNEYWQNFILDLPWILWYELKKFIWFLLFERHVLSGLKEIWRMRRDLKRKRLRIMALRQIDYKEVRKWWT